MGISFKVLWGKTSAQMSQMSLKDSNFVCTKSGASQVQCTRVREGFSYSNHMLHLNMKGSTSDFYFLRQHLIILCKTVKGKVPES